MIINSQPWSPPWHRKGHALFVGVSGWSEFCLSCYNPIYQLLREAVFGVMRFMQPHRHLLEVRSKSGYITSCLLRGIEVSL